MGSDLPDGGGSSCLCLEPRQPGFVHDFVAAVEHGDAGVSARATEEHRPSGRERFAATKQPLDGHGPIAFHGRDRVIREAILDLGDSVESTDGMPDRHAAGKAIVDARIDVDAKRQVRLAQMRDRRTERVLFIHAG